MSQDTMLFARVDETELEEEAVVSKTEKHLIFLSNGILYGVDAEYVAEIITGVSITFVPMLPPCVCGVINLRGQIVPIIDFRILLGQAPGEQFCTIVLEHNGDQIGILVDTVDQMVEVEKDQILPVPYQNGQHLSNLILGMYSLPDNGGTLMVLDCNLLCHEQ